MAEKKLRRGALPLPSLSEVEEFLVEFRSALNRGEFDPYLFEFVEAIDERVADRMQYAAEEPDAFVAAFLKRTRRLREGEPELVENACYSLLGTRYLGVVVRYIQVHGDKIRVEVVDNGEHKNSLTEGSTYRIPLSALDRQVEEPEGR